MKTIFYQIKLGNVVSQQNIKSFSRELAQRKHPIPFRVIAVINSDSEFFSLSQGL